MDAAQAIAGDVLVSFVLFSSLDLHLVFGKTLLNSVDQLYNFGFAMVVLYLQR